MFRKIVGAVNNASKWADTADAGQVAKSLDELVYSAVKLLFAFTHFVEFLVRSTVGTCINVVRGTLASVQGGLDARKSERLRGSLDWRKPRQKYSASTAYLRR